MMSAILVPVYDAPNSYTEFALNKKNVEDETSNRPRELKCNTFFQLNVQQFPLDFGAMKPASLKEICTD